MKTISLFLFSVLSGSVFSQQTDENPCFNADIIYIADWSGSIENFEYQLINGLNILIETIPPEEEKIRYGVVIFNDSSFIEESLTSDIRGINELLERLKFKKARGGTNMLLGLNSAYYLFKTQPRLTNKIIIIISDGMVNQGTREDVVLISHIMRESGIIIFSVDVGTKGTEEDFLREISSAYFQTNINNLSETLKGLFNCM